MTASLPLPEEQPSELDSASGVDEAAAAPPRPRRTPRPAASKDGAKPSSPRAAKSNSTASARAASTKKPATTKKPRATGSQPRSTAGNKPRSTSAKPPAAASAPADPGPPPPVPADLVVPEDIVIPPRPPLPLPVTESETDAPAAPDAVATSESEPARDADERPEVSTDADAVLDPAPESEPALETEPAPEPETAPEPEPVPEPETAPEPEPAPEPESAPQPEPELDTAPAEAPDAEIDPVPAAVLVVDDAASLDADADTPALLLRGVTKTFGETRAVDHVDLTVPAGSFYGLVGPNGAGKTTTLSMIAGLLRPDSGTIEIGGIDAAERRADAQRRLGVLPDRLRTFDRLTGRQLLYYYGVLRGLPSAVAESRTNDLARAFDLVDALGRPVSDYSAGMTKKVMLAGAMIHSPRVLVLDEPFESVDPVSSAVILEILSTYVEHGGTVILSSHGMQLVERVCTRVAVLVSGTVLAEGTVDDVRGTATLEERFLELVGGRGDLEGLEWLHTFSD